MKKYIKCCRFLSESGYTEGASGPPPLPETILGKGNASRNTVNNPYMCLAWVFGLSDKRRKKNLKIRKIVF